MAGRKEAGRAAERMSEAQTRATRLNDIPDKHV